MHQLCAQELTPTRATSTPSSRRSSRTCGASGWLSGTWLCYYSSSSLSGTWQCRCLTLWAKVRACLRVCHIETCSKPWLRDVHGIHKRYGHVQADLSSRLIKSEPPCVVCRLLSSRDRKRGHRSSLFRGCGGARHRDGALRRQAGLHGHERGRPEAWRLPRDGAHGRCQSPQCVHIHSTSLI